eukprot:scpid44006/ scgid14802/ Cystine/glutamate transporter; Amino acid transport system xc-; Solute carrier family 7 member 11; xCT
MDNTFVEDGGHAGNIQTELESTPLLRSTSVRPKLQRQITLTGAIAMTVSTVIGSGIFVSPNGIVKEVNSVGVSLLIWLGCGLAACAAALCICELGTAIPSAGGIYSFILRIYGKLPAFMFIWTFDLISNPAGLAIIHLTLAKYFVVLITDDPPDWAHKVCAVGFIVCLCAVNCIGVRFMSHVQTFLMFFKLLAILVIVIAGSIYLGEGNTGYIEHFFTNSTLTPTSFTNAFYTGLWAYNGWDALFHAGEEMENMATTLPLAIKIGMSIVTLAYLLANIAYMSLLSPFDLINSKAVAEAAVTVSLGKVYGNIIIPLFVALSCMGASTGSIFMVGRQVFAAAREGHFPHFLSLLHPKRNTPIPALVFPCVIAVLLLFLPTSGIEKLIHLSQFTMWIFYGACFAGIIVLRVREPDLHRPYKTWIAVPAILTLLSIYLLVTPFIKQPIASVVVVLIVLASIPVYFLVIVRSCFAEQQLKAVSGFLSRIAQAVCCVTS